MHFYMREWLISVGTIYNESSVKIPTLNNMQMVEFSVAHKQGVRTEELFSLL